MWGGLRPSLRAAPSARALLPNRQKPVRAERRLRQQAESKHRARAPPPPRVTLTLTARPERDSGTNEKGRESRDLAGLRPGLRAALSARALLPNRQNPFVLSVACVSKQSRSTTRRRPFDFGALRLRSGRTEIGDRSCALPIVAGEDQPAFLNHREAGDRLVRRRAGDGAGAQVEAGAVAHAFHLEPVHLAAGQFRTVVGAHVFHRVKGAVDVVDGDGGVAVPHHLVFARQDLAARAYLHP